MKCCLKTRIKWILFPGINLHARERYRILPEMFGAASGAARNVLDAGCGNGMLAYQSWKRGNRVLAVTIKQDETDGCRELFNEYMGIPEDELKFATCRIAEADIPDNSQDEIICSEVLEHINDDAGVIRRFYRWLKPGGILHLCCPNSDYPDNRNVPLDRGESGGHVRHGYTLNDYRSLLMPAGFVIQASIGLGSPFRQSFNRKITRVQEVAGLAAGLILFLCWMPVSIFDNGAGDCSYSIYVKAKRN